MEHIAALLLIIGCSDDLARCEELPAQSSAVFETAEECETEVPKSLSLFTGTHPQIFAQCIPVDPAMEEDAVLTWDVKPDGTLIASIGVPDVMVATKLHRTEQGYSVRD